MDIPAFEFDTNGTGRNCSQLSENQLKILAAVKLSLSSFSCFPCVLVFFLIIYFKRYRFFVHRLALYLTSAAIFYSIATALQSVPGDLFGIQNHHLCIAVGFLSQYGSWVLLLYIYWVISQLLLLSVCHVSTKKAEPFIVLLPVLLPIPISCIPFIHNLYGSAGAWCWIVTATADCEKVYAGQIEQFVLWYGPMFFASLGSVIVTLTTIMVLCRGACEATPFGEEDHSSTITLQAQHKQALKETLPLLAYAILFSLFDWVAIASRVYYAVTDGTNFPLWLVHAIGDACRGLFIPIAFLLHPSVLKRLNCKELKKAAKTWRRKHASMFSTTFFVVSREHSDVSKRLVVRGGDGNDENQDTGYQSIVDS